MGVGSTQPLTEMSTRNIPGGEGRPALKADNLTAICEPIFYKMWELQHLTTLWVSTSRYRDTFTFLSHYMLTVCLETERKAVEIRSLFRPQKFAALEGMIGRNLFLEQKRVILKSKQQAITLLTVCRINFIPKIEIVLS
jgi:hypothetical protein